VLDFIKSVHVSGFKEYMLTNVLTGNVSQRGSSDSKVFDISMPDIIFLEFET
jgi:hypothetical protein